MAATASPDSKPEPIPSPPLGDQRGWPPEYSDRFWNAEGWLRSLLLRLDHRDDPLSDQQREQAIRVTQDAALRSHARWMRAALVEAVLNVLLVVASVALVVWFGTEFGPARWSAIALVVAQLVAFGFWYGVRYGVVAFMNLGFRLDVFIGLAVITLGVAAACIAVRAERVSPVEGNLLAAGLFGATVGLFVFGWAIFVRPLRKAIAATGDVRGDVVLALIMGSYEIHELGAPPRYFAMDELGVLPRYAAMDVARSLDGAGNQLRRALAPPQTPTLNRATFDYIQERADRAGAWFHARAGEAFATSTAEEAEAIIRTLDTAALEACNGNWSHFDEEPRGISRQSIISLMLPRVRLAIPIALGAVVVPLFVDEAQAGSVRVALIVSSLLALVTPAGSAQDALKELRDKLTK